MTLATTATNTTPIARSTNGRQPIRRLLIANRGEIAVRVIRAARDRGIATILAHSDADRDSLAASMADRALCIGPAPARESYLNIDAILAAAIATDADAIHPGYGFLAENAAFSAACEANNVRFVGPRPSAVELMGNKIAARKLASRIGVPIIPGTHEAVAPAEARRMAEAIGYPVIVKAAGGGGGRGMRLVGSPAELEGVLTSASAEAQAAFGDGSVYVEKYLGNARHIEIQVAADEHGNTIHLGERDCTTQRRYQKLVEEGPSPALDPELRAEMGDAAVRLCHEVQYRGVGTVEFLFDQASRSFHFIEMNTRLQVEHPVTEELTGVDLVDLQLEIASGEPLPLRQSDVRIEGHAIEFRINAEDPETGFRPTAGTLERWIPPQGPAVRVDTHCYEGYRVPPYYDSLLAKVIVTGRDRDQAIARSRRALRELQVEGLSTTLPFHLWLLDQEAFRTGEISTAWTEQAWAGRTAK